ncbi:hypothetical protein [Pseudoalteromonas sp. S16_S37]|uniref:hypothetical protein n=1 Tax=Pseudoalteromonas sp. S16_S37 TaxID=2720228 RepID=UPI001681B9DF|nr:hypothetical protein [Pseudoalteromonas sp. S16_S37]MBD1583470.1 hypothetical protein [Pseudoalteromonas sp. S16_S37]
MVKACISCDEDLENVHDTTVSNIETDRCYIGQHTGNIIDVKNAVQIHMKIYWITL